ncbi:RloB family protein [Flavobacterium sp. MAHUQ-51]|uniref:RloB family protein n=1 Tax=Flavobacterium sp. GCM10022190 TaxID=3252639 RepID=UPI0036118B2D
MQRRKYSLEDYNKKDPFDDSCIKFFILYEGIDKEPNYFQAFCDTFLEEKRVYVHHILETNSNIKGNMPKNLLDRVKDFLDNPPKDLKFTPSNEDKFRFVLDVDKHPKQQIVNLYEYCETLLDSNLYISNFCFEIWLWFHLDEQENILATKSKEIKTELGKKQNQSGVNFPHGYMSFEKINKAIERAELADINKEDYFPAEKTTKVYLLMKELLKYSLINTEIFESEEI